MCESCHSGNFNRREFMIATSAIGAIGLTPALFANAASSTPDQPRRVQQPARVQVVFLYPPADVVNAGQLEDNWARHNWFTWPGNQFEPAQQERTFSEKIRQFGSALGITIEFAPRPIYQEAAVNAYIAQCQAAPPDAVLVINFWNTFAQWSYRIATESAPVSIVYQPVGSNHQLPPENLRTTEGLYYIHSIDNWDEIERGLRGVRARKMLAQSRLLRVSGAPQDPWTEETLGVEVVSAPASEFNALFDAVAPDEAMARQAMDFKKGASEVRAVEDKYFVEAMRAHQAVDQIMQRYGADAITIECLMLQHRKPCLSFAMNNGALIPNGCENDLNATLTLMLGRWLFDRAGFQHNPEFDTSNNHYFGAHCTCATRLHGPEGTEQDYLVRPFFHQEPKTAALDVQWPRDEPVILAKYLSGQNTLHCWTGSVIESPLSPPTGGCATRVLAHIDKVEDVCDIYSGPHPVLYCGDAGAARRMKAYARLAKMQLVGNI